MTATTILSEAGSDMSRWETEHHFVSWLRLCPDNRISGNKIIGKGRLPTSNRITNALKMAASTLRTSNTYLGAQFRRLRTKLGAPIAIKATAAKRHQQNPAEPNKFLGNSLLCDNRESWTFENRNAKDFWRIILKRTGPDTALTQIVHEGDQAMKVTLACVLLLLPLHASPQEPQKPTEEKPATESKSTSDTAKQQNPVKPTPSSIASGKKSYTYDCAMCHGKEGAGDGDLAGDMHLKLRDYRDPTTLKELTDGEIYSIIAKGKGKMTGEEGRMKPEQIWDMVNYIRSLAQK